MTALLFLDVFTNAFIFLTLLVVFVASFGIIAQSFSIMMVNGFMAFTALTLITEYSLYETVLIVVIIFAVLFTAFQVWGELFGGNSGGME